MEKQKYKEVNVLLRALGMAGAADAWNTSASAAWAGAGELELLNNSLVQQ